MLTSEQFGLTSSPFSLIPDADVQFWAGLPTTKRALEDVVKSVRTDDVGSSEFIVLSGNYGAGKSHALRFFAREAREKGGVSIYVDDILAGPKLAFSALARRISEGLNEEVEQRLVTSVKDAVRQCRDATNQSQDVPVDDTAIVRRFVSSADQETVLHIINQSSIPNLNYKDDYEVVRRLGSILRLSTWRIGDNEPPFQGSYLFLDEVESLTDQAATAQTAFFSSLRSLINALPNHFALILSFSLPTGVLESYLPQPIWERMTRSPIEVAQLSVDEATQFVKEYLMNVRPAGGFDAPQPFYPFSYEAVLAIFEQETSLVPRRILGHLRRVWERVARQELLELGQEISREEAERILEAVR